MLMLTLILELYNLMYELLTIFHILINNILNLCFSTIICEGNLETEIKPITPLKNALMSGIDMILINVSINIAFYSIFYIL